MRGSLMLTVVRWESVYDAVHWVVSRAVRGERAKGWMDGMDGMDRMDGMYRNGGNCVKCKGWPELGGSVARCVSTKHLMCVCVFLYNRVYIKQ
jgi:hypothetical protein